MKHLKIEFASKEQQVDTKTWRLSILLFKKFVRLSLHNNFERVLNIIYSSVISLA